MRTVIIAVVILLVVVGAAVVLWPRPNPNAGDTAKLNRSFNPAEQHLIDTVHISSQDLADATCEPGKPCWIAIDKVVYDVSGIPSWAKGAHHGVNPGHDVTDDFVRSGHPVDTLQKLPVVGSLESP